VRNQQEARVGNGRELQRRLARRRLTSWVSTAATRIADVSRMVIVVGGLLLAVAFNIPWLENPLQKLGFDNVTEVSLSIVTFLLVAIFYEVRSPSTPRDGERHARHFPDAMDVYPVLTERMTAIRRREDKVLDVLGMTLYTAWPTITFWLNRAELDNWTIRLTAVSPHHEEDLHRIVPRAWFAESTANLSDAARVAHLPRIQEKGIRIETHSYDFVPVLHGFRLGSGDLFWSLLEWDREGRICRDAYSYEFVPREDDSASAVAIRRVFDSWFTRARQQEWTAHTAGEPQSGIDPHRAFRPSSVEEAH
jgi:hypothetical protein